MIEFEKWRNEQKISGRSHKADARVWRAALEMVFQKLRNGEDHYTVGVLAGVEADIEEELRS